MSESRGNFGSFLKKLRLERGLTLRSFCIDNGFDPGNYSKLERGILPPPSARAKLDQYANALGLVEGTDEWYEFYDLAALSRNELPPTLTDEDILQRLPMFCRTIRNQRMEGDDLDKLIELIRSN